MKFFLSAFFTVLTSLTFGQFTVQVQFLNKDNTYTDITKDAELWMSTDLEGKEKRLLNYSNGSFKIDSLPSDCPYFHIKDQFGNLHVQKLCLGLKNRKNGEFI